MSDNDIVSSSSPCRGGWEGYLKVTPTHSLYMGEKWYHYDRMLGSVEGWTSHFSHTGIHLDEVITILTCIDDIYHLSDE